MIKVILGAVLGIIISVGTFMSVAHADITLNLFNAITTSDWEDKTPAFYKVKAKGNDLRVYEWQSALNPKIAIVSIFSNKGAMSSSFPIDEEFFSKLDDSDSD